MTDADLARQKVQILRETLAGAMNTIEQGRSVASPGSRPAED
ncbi:hypothetical protein [Rathayibacter tritici]|nr:hypothetical protein [Rathayibacter tritici]